MPRTKFIFRLNHPVPCAAHTSRTAMIFSCKCRLGRRSDAATWSCRCMMLTRTPRPKPRGFVSPAALSPTLLRRDTPSRRALVTGQWVAASPPTCSPAGAAAAVMRSCSRSASARSRSPGRGTPVPPASAPGARQPAAVGRACRVDRVRGPCAHALVLLVRGGHIWPHGGVGQGFKIRSQQECSGAARRQQAASATSS